MQLTSVTSTAFSHKTTAAPTRQAFNASTRRPEFGFLGIDTDKFTFMDWIKGGGLTLAALLGFAHYQACNSTASGTFRDPVTDVTLKNTQDGTGGFTDVVSNAFTGVFTPGSTAAKVDELNYQLTVTVTRADEYRAYIEKIAAAQNINSQALLEELEKNIRKKNKAKHIVVTSSGESAAEE